MKRLLILSLLIFSGNVHALTNQQTVLCFIPEAVLVLDTKCPTLLSGGTATPSQDSIAISGVVLTKPATTFYYLLHDNSIPFTNSVEDRDRLIRSASVITSASSSETIGNIQADSTGLYVTMIAEGDGYEGNALTFGPIDLVAGATASYRYNPGLYWGERTNFVDHPTYQQAFDRYSNGSYLTDPYFSSTDAGSGSKIIQGIRLKAHWAEIERDPGSGTTSGEFTWDIFDAALDALAPSGRRLIMGLDLQANNRHAGRLVDYQQAVPDTKDCEAVPPDLRNTASVLGWIRLTGKQRCLARVWIEPTVQTRYTNICMAMVARYKDNPRVEGFFCKGESSLGTPSIADNTFNPTDWDNYIIGLDAAMKAASGKAQQFVGINGLGSDDTQALARFDARRAVMDASGGFGIRRPDCFTRSTAPLPILTIDRLRIGQGTLGDYSEAADWQRPGQTYDNVADHWAGCGAGTVYTSPNFDGARAIPPAPGTTNFANIPTHPVIIPKVGSGADFANEANWKAYLQSINWDGTLPGAPACPNKWVAAGATCETGVL